MNDFEKIKLMNSDQLKAATQQHQKDVAKYFLAVTATKVTVLLLTRAAIKRYWSV